MQDWNLLWSKRKRFQTKQATRGKRRKSINKVVLLKWAGILSLGFVLVGTLVMFLLFAWFAKDLPNPNKVVRRSGFSTKIVDRQGQVLYELYKNENRIPVKLEDVSKYMREATVAVEDKDFYKHGGFDPKGIVRAAFNTIVRGKLQGGSTLTQQLVKNVLLSSKRTLSRKFKELVLAIQIERKFNKDEILQMYLNEAPYGGPAWGVAAGAERYFGKKPKDLNLVESAILAGLPQAPSRYSPYGANSKAYIARAQTVLRRMREDGYITREQEQQAIRELPKVKFKNPGETIKAPHFVFYVKKELVNILGERALEEGGFTVTTSLDYDLQEKAEEIVSEEIKKVESLHITNGAAMVMNPNTGEILAMVGSKDYFSKDIDGKVNVVLSLRQPGSSIKPVTYATAFEKGYSPATMLLDVPTDFGVGENQKPYAPKNYDGKFRGPVQLRFALGSSLNVPAVKLLALVGIKNMLQTAYEMGFETLQPTSDNMKRLGLSVTLGGGEVRLFDLVRSYSVFANGGYRIKPVAILKIEKNNKTIYKAQLGEKKLVLDKGVVFLINHVLYDNNARLLTFGPNSYLNMGGRPIAVKTGTTNDMRDNWTVGWSTKAVVGVWVGNNDNSPMKRVASGVTGASPIWRRIMLLAYEKYGGDEFVPPSNVVVHEVDTISGYLAHDNFPKRAEYFLKGAEPAGDDPVHKKLKLCKGEGKLATPVDIENNNYEEKEFVVLKDYKFDQGPWQSYIDEWLQGVEDPKFHPPEDYCDSKDDIIVKILEPADKSRIDRKIVKVRLQAITSIDLKDFYLEVDGKRVESFTSKDVETELHLEKGNHVLKAVASNQAEKRGEVEVRIGVLEDWQEPSPSPTPLPSPSPTPSSQASESGQESNL